MDFNSFKETAFKKALALGCTAAELYYVENDSFSVSVIGGETDNYSVSRSKGLNLRVQCEGKNGYAYIEKLDDPEALVERAVDNARAIEDTDKQPMQGVCAYAALDREEIALMRIDAREKIELAVALEKAALGIDARVQRVMETGVQSETAIKRICNTMGLDAEGRSSFAISYTVPVAMEGGSVRDAVDFGMNEDALDVEGIAKRAVEKAVGGLGASPVAPGNYRVILQNESMAQIVEAFSSAFSADAAQKGLSLLKDKLGQSVASELLNIVDDPFHEVMPRAFDDEGVPSVKTNIIENGVLKSFLHNLKTAKKAGVDSTSNGGRAGVSAPVGVMPSNLIVLPGGVDYEALVKQLGNGLIITSLDGLHSGLNPISGDFSLSASGRLVENGAIVRAVDQITVSGTFSSMMNSIEAIASDLKFSLPTGAMFGAPSVLFTGMAVSGK